MKKMFGRFLKIWSPVMIFAGIVNIVLDVLLTLSRYQDPKVSRVLAFVAAVVLLACGIFQIVAGVKSFALVTNLNRGYRYRAVSSKIASFKRLCVAAMLLSVVEIILSCVIGIVFWEICALLAAGILIPVIYLISIKTL